MIKNIKMKCTLIDSKLIDGKKTYWVSLLKDGKQKDVGCFTFNGNKPDINEVFLFIGNEVRLKKVKTWNDFFNKEEMQFLEKLSSTILDVNFMFDNLCLSKNKLNKDEVSFGQTGIRTDSIINILKTL